MLTFLMGSFLKCVADVPPFLEFVKHNDKYHLVSLPACSVVPFSTIAFPLAQKFPLVAQLVKNLLAMRKTWVWSLGLEEPLEKGKATHFIFWPGELQGLYSPWGCRVRHD